MLRIVTPVEHDGLNQRTLLLIFDVPNAEFDLETAVKAASKEFCQTESGKNIYLFTNCHNFNWADFDLYVPNSICKKYGFTKVENDILYTDKYINWDEQLVTDEDICADED